MEQIKLSSNLPDELLYGRAGFLWACVFLNKHLGEGTIPSTTTVSIYVNRLLSLKEGESELNLFGFLLFSVQLLMRSSRMEGS